MSMTILFRTSHGAQLSQYDSTRDRTTNETDADAVQLVEQNRYENEPSPISPKNVVCCIDMTIVAVSILFVILLAIINLILFAVRR